MMVNKKHKDRLFRFIFGNPEKREWTLNLYNAINNSHYTNPDDIEYNTIEDAIYLGMKNDVSFIILNNMNLWEYQSSFNPNMPVRFLIYAARLYEKYIEQNEINRFSRNLKELPRPKCLCFYNGFEPRPDKEVLKLSDAFVLPDSDIEVRVTMLNINYGHNRELMELGQQLREYACERVRMRQEELESLDLAVDAAIDEMPDSFSIKKFLLAHRAEVKGMFLTEYNEEKERRLFGLEEHEAGRVEGISSVVINMLKNAEPLEKIKMYSNMAEQAIYNLANSIGVSVVN